MKAVFWATLLFLTPSVAFGSETITQPAYKIVVDFSDIAIHLFDGEKLVASYPVALPRVTPKLPATGRVVKIVKDPAWYPTESTRKYYFEKKKVELPKRIEPGSKINAMGKAKIIIEFDSGSINCVVRVHGTNDPTSIGKRVSRGCIRMRNEDILALAKIVLGKDTKVVFAQ